MVPLLVSAIQEVLVIVPLMLSKLADLFNGRSYTCPCARVKFIIYLVHFTILLFLTRYFLRICFSLIILKSELYDNLSSDLPVFCLYLNKRTNLIDQFLFYCNILIFCIFHQKSLKLLLICYNLIIIYYIYLIMNYGI